ncbi:MAG: hypothetical protein ABII01_06460 [Candidatus Woesearchaeota archaeon]
MVFIGKKGVTETIKAIIGIVLAIMGILILLPLIVGVLSMLTGGVEQGTLESASHLNEAIIALKGSSQDKCFIPIYLQPDLAIVGFETGDRNTMEYCGVNEEINKPTDKCGVLACFCLCDGGKFDLGEDDCLEPEICYNLDEISGLKTKDDDGNTYDLVLYSEACWSGGNEGVNSAVIEKTGDTISVYYSKDLTGIKLCDELVEYEVKPI